MRSGGPSVWPAATVRSIVCAEHDPPVARRLMRVRAVLCLVVCVAAGAACASSTTGGASRQQAPVDWRGHTHVDVDATSDRFVPAEIVISPGTTVTWHNRDTVTHNIQAVQGTVDLGGTFGADSGAFGPGTTYAFTFTKLGDFAYTCTIHPSMTGDVRVTT
jgi:plastocyanin